MLRSTNCAIVSALSEYILITHRVKEHLLGRVGSVVCHTLKSAGAKVLQLIDLLLPACRGAKIADDDTNIVPAQTILSSVSQIHIDTELDIWTYCREIQLAQPVATLCILYVQLQHGILPASAQSYMPPHTKKRKITHMKYRQHFAQTASLLSSRPIVQPAPNKTHY